MAVIPAWGGRGVVSPPLGTRRCGDVAGWGSSPLAAAGSLPPSAARLASEARSRRGHVTRVV